ncbi:MAG: hypothetical protein GY859_15650 [Desulfobacterales bacterium]|nr:hypothetical protein [Desulfobacterales bacterium]
MISANTTEIQAIISPNRTAEPGGRVPQRAEAEAKKAPTEEKPAVRVDAQAPPEGLAEIDAMKEKRNVAAATVRQVDATMENIDENLDHMKDQLVRIVKQYPPYPPESRERADYLKSFAHMRKIIESLTYPRDASQEVAAPRMEAPMEATSPPGFKRLFVEETQGRGAGGHE